MLRITGPLLAFALALANAPANAQVGATLATGDNGESAYPSSNQHGATAQPPGPDEVCHALEQSAAENALPVEFLARVIWQESRFDAWAVSPRGHRASPNSCRGPLVGAGLPIRSTRYDRADTSDRKTQLRRAPISKLLCVLTCFYMECGQALGNRLFFWLAKAMYAAASPSLPNRLNSSRK